MTTLKSRTLPSPRSISRWPFTSWEQVSPRVFAGLGEPVILEGLVPQWRAAQWDFTFFAVTYGDDVVHVTEDWGYRGAKMRRVLLRHYVDYCRDRSGSPLARHEQERPFYLANYDAFTRHPELLADFVEPLFLGSYFRDLTPTQRSWYVAHFGWVFMGPAGTVSRLHVDLHGTHAWLAQVHGRKRILAFSPDEGPKLGCGQVDPREPDLERFPAFADSRPWLGTLEPGDFLVLPRGWWHHVEALTPSISLTFNFVNAHNFGEFLMSLLENPIPDARPKAAHNAANKEAMLP